MIPNIPRIPRTFPSPHPYTDFFSPAKSFLAVRCVKSAPTHQAPLANTSHLQLLTADPFPQICHPRSGSSRVTVVLQSRSKNLGISRTGHPRIATSLQRHIDAEKYFPPTNFRLLLPACCSAKRERCWKVFCQKPYVFRYFRLNTFRPIFALMRLRFFPNARQSLTSSCNKHLPVLRKMGAPTPSQELFR